MRTTAQTETSRRNGALSHGPATEDGRRRSSQNATSHGIFSQQVILPGEDAAEFHELEKAITDRLEPSTFEESEIVRELVVLRWRIRRCYAIETRLCSAPVSENMTEAAQQFTAMDRIGRYQSRLRKLEATAEGRLKAIQEDRQEKERARQRRDDDATMQARVLRNRIKDELLRQGILEDSTEETVTVEQIMGVETLPADLEELARLLNRTVVDWHLRKDGIDPETGDWIDDDETAPADEETKDEQSTAQEIPERKAA